MSMLMPAAPRRSVAPAVTAVGRAARPPLRLIHHLARSGGTVISKCLGCMAGVVLLSEIHPLGTGHFNPLLQAQRWYGLLSTQDLIELKARGRIGFGEAIELIRRRAEDCNQRLLIRDWSHLDFTGVPLVARPAQRLLTAEALAGRYHLHQVCTVRHPLDQWLSLSRLPVMRGRLSLEAYLAGYRRFAEVARAIGFQRYEDFASDPNAVLRSLCESLQLKFDRGFAGRWREYTFVTGDLAGSGAGSEIRPVPRRPVAPELAGALAANEDYRASLELLGYQHPAA